MVFVSIWGPVHYYLKYWNFVVNMKFQDVILLAFGVYQTTWPASWETCIQVRKQQLELDMEQQTGSK